MLPGDPPYTGATPQAILARKLTEPLPRLSVVRQSVPPGLEDVIAEEARTRAPADPSDAHAPCLALVPGESGPGLRPRPSVIRLA